MSQMQKAKVIFRKWKDANAMSLCRIIAVFPEIPADALGIMCMSFEHVGQHGACSPIAMLENTEPISEKDAEVRDLIDELHNRGYELDIVKTITTEMTEIRAKNARSGL